jgi:glyoxylase-like metal-dependent hydrolase (beta-lactamase superfamily II)
MFRYTSKKFARKALLALAFAQLANGGAALAAAPMASTGAPGYFRMMLGQFEVTALSDGTVDLPVDTLLAQAPDKTKAALARSFLSTPLETSVTAYLINTGSKLVLIDTGAGGLFGPTLGKLLSNLKASGYQPEQIDEVYLTHIHPDHSGGLVINEQLAFPNASVRADRRDAEFWLSSENMKKAPDASKGFFEGAVATLTPYVSAGKFHPFSGNTELLPGINAVASYGHTKGHVTYLVTSQGKKLWIAGDLIHVAAVQLPTPGVTIGFDLDQKAAAAARAHAFAQVAKDGTLVAASHIQFPGIGHLRREGPGYQWVPMNYTRMR